LIETPMNTHGLDRFHFIQDSKPTFLVLPSSTPSVLSSKSQETGGPCLQSLSFLFVCALNSIGFSKYQSLESLKL
jgi:hypothetical protein